MKVLHIVGGSPQNGAYQGAKILHDALVNLKVDSKILNDSPPKNCNREYIKKKYKVIFINDTLLKKILNKSFILIEKILKTLFLSRKRSTFTIGLFGFDITKIKEYNEADVIHIHWFGQGFISIKSLSKIKKNVIWTMRDMWPFTGGSHYTSDFEDYERGFISKKLQNYKKKNYPKNITFVAISEWLKKKAIKSSTLKPFKVVRIYNNINMKNFRLIAQKKARSIIRVATKKKIILYGAHNVQNNRKGWSIFVKTLKKLDKSKYFLLIFGNFWSNEELDSIGIDYKSLGFIKNKKLLNAIYSSADVFVFPSAQEAFGKTWAEALACNIPIVCFDNTSTSEIVDHKKNSYIVKNFSPKSLSRGIEWILNRNKKPNSKKIISKKKLLNFDSKIVAKEYIKLYQKVLKKNFE